MTRMRFQFNPRPGARPAFTLVELMISIALVLLLMLGINQVFKVTGEAVGTNAAISTAIRDARAAQNAFGRDIAAWAADAPAIILRSERVSAFRNRADAQSDRDYDPTAGLTARENAKRTVDIDGNGVEGEAGVLGEIVSPAIYNHRSHRVDRFSFFARGLFRRQTGGALPTAGINAEEYTADMSSPEAWIWYGHIKRPDERTLVTPPSNQVFEHRDPGDDPNPTAGVYNDRNWYASDFVLGRMAMLLLEGTDLDMPPDGVGDEIVDRRGIRQRFVIRRRPLSDTSSLSPLVENVRSNESNTSDQWTIQWSRYDLTNTSISNYRAILTNWLLANPLVPPSSQMAWWRQLGDWRFQGDPQPLRPLNADNAARTTPVFLEHCSQFIVEFAGDFLIQDQNTGAVSAYRTGGMPGDGIDFLIDNSTGTPVRRIRWYGMPRDVAGASNGGPDGAIRGNVGDPNQLVDVVPLLNVMFAAGITYTPPVAPPGQVQMEFIERRLPWSSPTTPPGFYTAPNGMGPNDLYVVAWGPDTADQPRPEMIRIVITLDDPEGRIADGQTFEYVFRIGG